MDQYVVKYAGSERLGDLEALERQCFSTPWTRRQLAAQLPDDQHVFLVACLGEDTVGYVGMMHVLDEGYISNVAVSPQHRRKGLGDMLIKELLVRAEKLELSFVTLEVRAGNAAAIALYEKHGFVKVGQRKNYYDLPKEDALLMSKFLK